MSLLLLLVVTSVGMAHSFEGRPEYTRTSLGDAIDVSTMKILKAAYDEADDKNVVSSPLGMMLLLSMYNSGASDGAREEINRLLGGPDYKQQTASYISLNQEFSSMNASFLTLANKVYVSKSYTLAEQFVATVRSYRSEVDTLDFSKPADAAKVINQWASEKTEGNIPTPVSADVLSSDTAVGLFNVIYFKGHWHVPFKAEETKEKDFHVDKNTTVKKPTMHLLQSLYYAESAELGVRMVELPYKEHGFRMVVVLPNEVDGLPSVLEKAAQKGLLSDVFNLNTPGRKVDLDMPKFDIRSKLDFNDILPKVGVSKIFSEAATGIVEAPVKVAEAFQEAFIKVDEEGATAGAFTGLVAVRKSAKYIPPPPIEIKVDRPFLFAILYNDKILFAGTYTK